LKKDSEKEKVLQDSIKKVKKLLKDSNTKKERNLKDSKKVNKLQKTTPKVKLK